MSKSDDILANARGHFEKMRGQTIEIPEWGSDDAPLIGHFDPPTLRKRQEIEKRAGQSEARRLALAVILCLLDEKGAPIFTDDAVSLNTLESGVDSKVVARVAAQMLGLTPASELGN